MGGGILVQVQGSRKTVTGIDVILARSDSKSTLFFYGLTRFRQDRKEGARREVNKKIEEDQRDL